jgi:hypothetical protein
VRKFSRTLFQCIKCAAQFSADVFADQIKLSELQFRNKITFKVAELRLRLRKCFLQVANCDCGPKRVPRAHLCYHIWITCGSVNLKLRTWKNCNCGFAVVEQHIFKVAEYIKFLPTWCSCTWIRIHFKKLAGIKWSWSLVSCWWPDYHKLIFCRYMLRLP